MNQHCVHTECPTPSSCRISRCHSPISDVLYTTPLSMSIRSVTEPRPGTQPWVKYVQHLKGCEKGTRRGSEVQSTHGRDCTCGLDDLIYGAQRHA
jgi:hypothetical protein